MVKETNTKSNVKKAEIKSKVEEIETETKDKVEEVRMDEKVSVSSIAPWITGFARIITIGDVSIPPNGTVRLSREEVLAQGQSNNKLITGIDGIGSHATLYIEDAWLREELGFDTDETKQQVLTKELVKTIFEKKTMPQFKKEIEENVVTRAERFSLLNMIKTLKINDYNKIAFCEEHCGAKLNA